MLLPQTHSSLVIVVKLSIVYNNSKSVVPVRSLKQI